MIVTLHGISRYPGDTFGTKKEIDFSKNGDRFVITCDDDKIELDVDLNEFKRAITAITGDDE